MKLTFRAKLILIVGAATLSILVVMGASTLIGLQQTSELHEVEHRMVPRLELAPRLSIEFRQLRRSYQDAVAAQDEVALRGSSQIKEKLLRRIATAEGVLASTDIESLRDTVQQYDSLAMNVSQRLLSGETGEALVEDMATLQAKQVQFEKLLDGTVTLDHAKLTRAFEALRNANQRADRFRFFVGMGGLIIVVLLSVWSSRSVLASLNHLSTGLGRFATGDFRRKIPRRATQDLGSIANEANQMAASLEQLAKERDRADWIKEGQADLAAVLRGELTPPQMAARALDYLARRTQAAAGALYLKDEAGNWAIVSHVGGGPTKKAGPASSRALGFAPGQGLVGRAALGEDLLLVHDLPADYCKIQSGLGEARPKTLALLPLSRRKSSLGVVELALFDDCREPVRDLLRSIRETLTIAFEAALSRAELEEVLAETREQADRLVAQEEELRVNNHELHAQQDELRSANSELTAQRQALRENNASLENARQRLQEKAEELTRVSSYKSQFLANMSHELRTPLNSMLLLSHLLAENAASNLSPKQVEHCKTIHAAGEDLLQLINQILDLAKIEAGRQELHWQRVPLEHFAQFAQRRFADMALEKGLALTVEVAPGLPETIVTDTQRLERILTNLLGNAIKFTDEGAVSLTIAKAPESARFQNDELRLKCPLAFVVFDTGPGIAMASQEKVFMPFEQVEGRSDRRHGGTGLGLAIARESALLLGGELHLESSAGTGSTFTCLIPEQPDHPVQLVQASERSLAPSGVATLAPAAGEAHLLIVEDDPVLAEQLAEIIGARRLKALVARTGAEGLRLAHQPGVVGIILDVRLPDIDGWTVMDHLRRDELTRDIPVHFITAVDKPERGFELGAVGYLVKPVTHAELTNAVFTLTRSTESSRPKVLVVEDDITEGRSIVALLQNEAVEVTHVMSAEAALSALEEQDFGCMILDLGLPDMDGLTLLERATTRIPGQAPRVVVHTGRALTKQETAALAAYSEAVILKDERSGERLLEEVRCFVRHLKEGLEGNRKAVSAPTATHRDLSLAKRKILLAEDDMRTVYALSALMLGKGAQVLVAENGHEALDLLRANPDVHCVLMDIMMPEMDGYEAMRRLRQDPRFGSLVVIALTAKAMKGERERCISAGANDYLAKPVDAESLLDMLRRWLGKEQLVVQRE